jgi:probable Rubsico expression protein CbbX
VTDAGTGPGRGFSFRSGPAPESAPDQGAGNGRATTDFGDEILPDDALVDVGSEEAAVHTKEVLDRLDRDLVGLVPVKSRIREIGDLLLVDRLRRRFGIESTRPTLHMSFTGSPGTGKTTVALRMAELLHRLGYLQKGHLVSVTRDDLVGQYIGHTAPKTKEVLKRAMGGVLFIDEAYYLYRQENERDYGQETIEILLQLMESQRENLVVILAGYKDRMDTFFQSNPGMGSRIAHHINFPDYSLDELVQIALLMLDEQRYVFAPDAEAAFRDYLELRRLQPRFANARSVRNALERARLRQAARIVANPNRKLSKADLMRIEAEDILQSRVFDLEETPGIDPVVAEPNGEK